MEWGHSTSLLFMYRVLHVCTPILCIEKLSLWSKKCTVNNSCTLMHFQEWVNLSRCCRECKSRSVYFCRPAATQVTFPCGEEELPLCSPVRYVLKIHFFIEFGLKMIQFKTKSKIFIQKNIHSKQNPKYSFKKIFIQ